MTVEVTTPRGTGRATAIEALTLASHKLPIRTKISVRPDYEG